MKLEDCKVIVTGAGGGLGACFVERLAAAGAKVAAGDIQEEALAALPEGVHTRRLDVGDREDVASFVRWAAESMGGVNVLVNNAGIIRDGLLVKKPREGGAPQKLSEEDWDAVLRVNLTGATWMVRETVGQMIESEERGGLLVQISSISRHGNRGQSSYVAAKAALAANAVTWAREFSRLGVRSVAIAPGMVETPMTKGMNQRARDALVAAIPVGRIGLPEDIWLALRFAIECEYFNGRCLDVDGGLVMT